MSLVTLLKSLGQNPTNRQLKEVSKALGEISVLDLSNQNLNAADLKNLFSALSLNAPTSYRRLTTLNLAGNVFGGSALDKEIMLSLIRAIREYPNLKHLNLAHNHISEEGIQILVSGLSSGTTLDCLQLEGNSLLPKFFEDLFHMIANCETRIFPVTFLGPSYSEVENELLEVFEKNREKVKKKEIREPILALLREMGENPTSGQHRALIEMLSKITQLDLSFQNLTAEHIVSLAKALESNTSIKELNLAGNQLGGVDEFGTLIIKHRMAILSLAKVIRSNSCLTDLNLTDNHINDEGLDFLAQALEQNNTLTSFRLNRNAFTTKGLYVLLSVIASSNHRIFPILFLSSLLFEEFPGIKEEYFYSVYKPNEDCVQSQAKGQQPEQEELAEGAREEIEKLLSETRELVQRFREGAMGVGQIPPITIAREAPGSQYVETKSSIEWAETTYSPQKKTAGKKPG